MFPETLFTISKVVHFSATDLHSMTIPLSLTLTKKSFIVHNNDQIYFNIFHDKIVDFRVLKSGGINNSEVFSAGLYYGIIEIGYKERDNSTRSILLAIRSCNSAIENYGKLRALLNKICDNHLIDCQIDFIP